MSSFFTYGVVVIKSGKLLFNYPQGAHDDRFWALALSVYAAEMAPPPASRPIGKII